MRAACRASDHRDASRAGEGEDGGGGVGQEPRDRVRRADDEGGDEGVGERRQLGRRRVHVEHERRRSREGLAVELARVDARRRRSLGEPHQRLAQRRRDGCEAEREVEGEAAGEEGARLAGEALQRVLRCLRVEEEESAAADEEVEERAHAKGEVRGALERLAALLARRQRAQQRRHTGLHVERVPERRGGGRQRGGLRREHVGPERRVRVQAGVREVAEQRNHHRETEEGDAPHLAQLQQRERHHNHSRSSEQDVVSRREPRPASEDERALGRL
mmetsp:Transcript_34163/g.101718  ORF Transcript_34163/g.101718 Transcript_34163/m.101718 type:complete len:275 (-) Transcript_34163:76-900(-)